MKSNQLELKNRFIQNQISGVQLLKELMKLDQSDPKHPDCFDNIQILEDEEVKARFLSSDIELKSRYLDDLSFFNFHAFQGLALSQDKQEESLEYLKTACDLRDEWTEINPDDENLFLPYMKATLAYMENDLERLQMYLNELEMVDEKHPMYVNTKIIRGLRDDLSTNEVPDYIRSYN